ncbi:hypothetical protein [Pedobacter xixiisoli]|uniref:Holin-X, holin superfamily III n=1 Tax=Pedobacter xixiisoli TaxID=1476464 RepID=A0A285ZSK9_9SPHI|nr:hypothetical protein [Pedobacter xixiisoli]SOD12650.1 hypothetical protein SAMN06297358_0777 [Pedobacter xixiisoli]
MQKKLRQLFVNYWNTAKNHAKARIQAQKYKVVLAIFKLLADLITNASIVVCLLLVIFLTSITLSFSLSVFFGSHVLGFLAATLTLTLAALLVLWKRKKVENYFAGLTIARYFEKRRAANEENLADKRKSFDFYRNAR